LYFYLSKILAPLLNLTNLLFILLIIFYSTDLKSKFRFKLFSDLILILLILISFFPLGKLGLKYLEKDYILQDKINKIDNIVVLAGSEKVFSTEVTKKLSLNDGSERLISSAKLALDYPNSKIYYLGGDGRLVKSKFNEADVAKIFYSNIHLDLNKVIFINNTRNTIENLKAFKNINTLNQSNILVTSAFHMKRSMMIAKKLDLNIKPYAVDFRSINDFDILNYYQIFSIADNWQSFNIFFRELLGIFVFKLFY
jgi:uncharacterized SAM-binding protein YcdF (DUF218 family)